MHNPPPQPGWCGSDDDCLGRSKTALGSSKSYAPTRRFTGGYFSSDPTQNPLMWNWTKAYLPYCDGGSQTGEREEPVTVGSSTIFYRGHRILRAVQDYLGSTTLKDATDIVVSGCSAGGLATYLHADEWAAAFPAARVTAMPDSGAPPRAAAPAIAQCSSPASRSFCNRATLIPPRLFP